MKTGASILCAAFILVLGLSAGCSKKRVESTSSGPVVDRGISEQQEKEQMKEDAAAKLEKEKALREQELEEKRRMSDTAKKEFEDALVELGDIVYFDFDSFEIKQEYRPLLQSKAELLKKFSNVTIVLEGFCDDRGTEEYNLALGERRARAAYEFLILLGVAPERLSIVSFGEEKPAVPENNETAWAVNRRVQFRLSY